MAKEFLGTRSTIRTSILKKVLPVPETIRIEADEFVFTMAAALGEVEILPEALFSTGCTAAICIHSTGLT